MFSVQGIEDDQLATKSVKIEAVVPSIGAKKGKNFFSTCWFNFINLSTFIFESTD